MEKDSRQNISGLFSSLVLRTFRFSLSRTYNRGFTIIESLIAIVILMLAITAPLTMAERALATTQSARNEVTAFYLAQEAVEYVRNLRDTNAITGKGGTSAWLDGLSLCTDAAGCGIDATANAPDPQIISCNVNVVPQNCLVYQYTGGLPDDPQRGLFGHRTSPSAWTPSVFTRKVYVSTPVDPNKEAKVTATVSWGGALGGSVTASADLLNWYTSPP